jgi:hypothetical protein
MVVFWVVAPCSLIEEVNFYQTTRRYKPEDSHLRIHRRENLKSYFVMSLLAHEPLATWRPGSRICEDEWISRASQHWQTFTTPRTGISVQIFRVLLLKILKVNSFWLALESGATGLEHAYARKTNFYVEMIIWICTNYDQKSVDKTSWQRINLGRSLCVCFQVTFTKRFLQSDAYKKAVAVGRPVFTEFGTGSYPDPCKNIFSRMMSTLVSLSCS